jgi:hypothetical protein
MTNKELIKEIFERNLPYFGIRYSDSECKKGTIYITRSDSDVGSFASYGNISRFSIIAETYRVINFGDGAIVTFALVLAVI